MVRYLSIAITAAAMTLGMASPHPGWAQPAIATETLSLVDTTRKVASSMTFKGRETRRLDVTLWSPPLDGDEAASPRPLLIYSHGTYGAPDNAMHLVRALVARGYIVAAPAYPLTARGAYTQMPGPDIADVHNQPRDISFILDSLLSSDRWKARIDPQAIGLFGHSLGAVTSYFTVYGAQSRDPRVKAMVSLGGGDPVQAALSNDMGLAGTYHAPVPVPALFLSAEHDVFARLTGEPYAAYARVPAPKFEVMVDGGTHVWFRDGDDPVADGRNPDCAFFDRSMPNAKIPGCSGRYTFTTAEHERDVARYAVTNFFDGFLRGDQAALQRLRNIDQAFKGVKLKAQEQ